MNRIFTYILSSVIGACLMALVSCSGSFLDQYPGNDVVADNFYKDDNDFNQAVRGCYSCVKSDIAFHLVELSYRSDESNLTAMNVSTQDRYDLDHFCPLPNNSVLSQEWDLWYNGIYRCNDVLLHLEGMTVDNGHRYRGEALFLRAWFYFNLYRVFGVVPLTRTVVSADVAKNIARCTREDMRQLLIKDLRAAADLLPVKPDAERARVTSMAALALLAKVYLTFGDHQKALEVLDEAMLNPNFGMEQSTAAVFDVNNKLNKEMIFAVYYNKSNGNGHSYWFGQSKNVFDEIDAPATDFRGLYDDNDNRKSLINVYIKIGTTYVPLKWYDEYDAVYVTQVGNDFPHLRYADVVLMRAEALAVTDVASALEWLNLTRVRAGLQELTAEDVPDHETFILELAAERGREFALEGQRWFDLVRLGLAVDYFRAKGYSINDNDRIMPIPQNQIEIVNDKSILWQNPGYD